MTLTYTDGEPVQVGDRVTVGGVVRLIGGDAVQVTVSVCGNSTMPLWFPPKEFLSHSSPQIKAGDMVTSILWDGPACVKSVDGDYAWVLLPSGRYWSVALSRLRRVTP